jgi:VWFA-related protein
MNRALALAITVGLSAIGLARLAAQDPRPQRFRSGVDVMRLEVTVLDERRQPVRGIPEGDFSIHVDGRLQKLVAFSEVEMPVDAPASADWVREAANDVASNAMNDARLFVIILDDAVVPFRDPFHRSKSKDIAHRVIDGLGARDLAAVVFTLNNSHAQDLTADRSLLRRAVDTFQPWGPTPQGTMMSLGTLRRTREFLAGLPERRSAVVYVTTGPIQSREQFGLLGLSEDPGAGALPDQDLHALADGSRLSQVPVYAFSLAGLAAPEPVRGGGIDLSPFGRRNEWLRTLSNLSGGRAALDTNAPERETSRMFGELRSYYALAYEPDYPMDGRRRRVEIHVNRPGTTVLPGQRHFVTPSASAVASVTTTRPARAGLLDALSSPLSVGAMPLRLVATPIASARPPGRDVAVAITLGVGLPAGAQPGSVEDVGLEVFVTDGEGRKRILRRQQSARMTRTDGEASEYEVATRVDLPPGRYHLRVAARRSSDAATGSVFTTFTVPDFGREALSLTGVAIGRAHPRAVGGRDVLDDLLPFAPTVERTFAAGDKVGALVRLFQTGHPAVPVSVATRITDASGSVVFERSNILPASAFESRQGADHQFELPLSTLTPGRYLLSFAAPAAARAPELRRDVRFTVRP